LRPPKKAKGTGSGQCDLPIMRSWQVGAGWGDILAFFTRILFRTQKMRR